MSLPKPFTEGSAPDPSVENAGETAVAEIGGDLQAAVVRYVSSTLNEWRALLADVEKRYEAARWKPADEREHVAGLLEYTRFAVQGFERLATQGPPMQDHLTPADFSWHDITAAWAYDEAAGRALWDRLKQTARDELRLGKAGAAAIEGYQERPMVRAEYLAVWVALADGLQPANGTERLLIDGLAQALMMHRHWLTRMMQTESMDTIRRGQRRDGYDPPRLSEAEAVDRAALMADRFQRQFLRLMKCFRDGRRLGLSMTVTGGQVNVAEQQINVVSE